MTELQLWPTTADIADTFVLCRPPPHVPPDAMPAGVYRVIDGALCRVLAGVAASARAAGGKERL